MKNINNFKTIYEIIKEKERIINESNQIINELRNKDRKRNIYELKNELIEKKEELNNINILLSAVYNHNTNSELINIILNILNKNEEEKYKIEIIYSEKEKSFESYTSNKLPNLKRNINNNNNYTVIAFTKNVNLAELLLNEEYDYSILSDLYELKETSKDIIIYDLIDEKIDINEYLKEKAYIGDRNLNNVKINKGLDKELVSDYKRKIKK